MFDKKIPCIFFCNFCQCLASYSHSATKLQFIRVDKNKNVEKSLLGKISDITKTFSRKFIYKDGIIGQYHEKRIAVEKFVPEGSGFLCDRKLTNVKKNKKYRALVI